MNIENILIEGTNTLKQSCVSNPQLDCEILLSNSINKDKKYIILNPKQILNEEQLSDFKSLIERRKKGEPIAYLINKKVDELKDEIKSNKNNNKILEEISEYHKLKSLLSKKLNRVF